MIFMSDLAGGDSAGSLRQALLPRGWLMMQVVTLKNFRCDLGFLRGRGKLQPGRRVPVSILEFGLNMFNPP